MASVAQELSGAAAAAVERGGRSVLRVEGSRRGPSSGVAWSADGVVVAAHHSVEWDEEVGLGLSDGQPARATVVGRDPTTDVAVLRVQPPGVALTPPSWAEADRLKVGHFVLGLSRPGRTVRATLGVVNALGEEWRTLAGGKVDRYVQSDIDPRPGFSGGLLVDLAGAAIGLNTSGLLRGSATALPVPTLRRVVGSLLTHGQVRRGLFGIGTMTVRLPAPAAGPGQAAGLLVTAVQPGSAAEAAGLLLGDVLMSVEGQPVASAGDLLPFLEEEKIGRELGARVLRAGQVHDVRVKVGEPEDRARRTT